MDNFLTKKQLAELLQVTERSIDNWIKEKILTPVKGLPVIRFSPKLVAELQGIELTAFSPMERRKLLKEVEEWKYKAERAENALIKANIAIMEAIQR